jgi:hypothetical protein
MLPLSGLPCSGALAFDKMNPICCVQIESGSAHSPPSVQSTQRWRRFRPRALPCLRRGHERERVRAVRRRARRTR